MDEVEQLFLARLQPLARLYDNEHVHWVVVTSELREGPLWRDRARAWVAGQGVTNQGRVRSDNLAPRVADGLLFRSQPEINLYRALKSLGVSFAPLPVFIRGGETYRRIEPDLVVLKDGVVLVVEVDGDIVHRQTPLDAYNRSTMLVHEGTCRAGECGRMRDGPEGHPDSVNRAASRVNGTTYARVPVSGAGRALFKVA